MKIAPRLPTRLGAFLVCLLILLRRLGTQGTKFRKPNPLDTITKLTSV